MAIPGQFGVSASGAATYSIAINVPPGTAGVAPALSLEYSSQSGNGIVGLGWMLSGLESIERCPRTYAQDGIHGGVNYDANDRFCFEGQRLVAISGTYGANGTQYRTEVETFSKIISYGSQGAGPQFFRVWTKSGQIIEFGNSTDSRPLTTDGANTPRSWAVNKISDIKGSYVAVSYVNDTANGQIYPSRLDYTGNASTGLAPYNSVRFVYNTARPDQTKLYHAGSFTQTTVLLTNVQAYSGSTLVYDYRLNYELGSATRHSRLLSVMLCDGNNACLKPTSFGWQGTRDTIAATTSTFSTGGSDVTFGDFNGDGVLDMLSPREDSADTSPVTGAISLALGTGAANLFSSNVAASVSFARLTCANASCSVEGGAKPLIPIDATGSGIPDLILGQSYKNFAHVDTSYGSFYLPAYGESLVRNSSLDGTLFIPSATIGVSAVGSNCCFTPYGYIGDFNGDGRGEYVGVLSNGDGTFSVDRAHSVPAFNGSTLLYTGDFDGDGCTDTLTLASNTINYYCSPARPSLNVPNWSGSKIITGDFNGDGMADVLTIPSSGSGTLYFSSGTGLSVSSYAVPSSWASADSRDLNTSSTSNHQVLTGDFNGDGKTDIVHITTSAINVYLSTGNGFVLANSIAKATSSFYGIVSDFNSDGVDDLNIMNSYFLFSYTPELMTTVTSGTGAATTIIYDRLNKNGSFYTKCPNSPSSYACGDSYPTQAVDGAMYVVTRVDSANGIGGNFSTAYAYAGYKADLRGRGSLGFAQVKATNLQTNIVETTKYRQDYPHVGQIETRTSVLSGVTLRSVSNSYVNANLGTSVEGLRRYFVGLTQSTSTANDLDGTALPSSSTTSHYDCQDSTTCFGNVLTTSESVSTGGVERSSNLTTNTYWNDADNWFIGRVTGTTVTRSVAGDQGTVVPNRAPTAMNDSVQTNVNTAVTFDPRANDSDADGDPLTISAVGTASHGTVQNNGTSITYTPAASYYGADILSYTIRDSMGHEASASVSVTVNYVNRPPTANADSIVTDENVAKTFDPRINDSDPEGNALTIASVTAPSHGTVSNAGTSLTYKPATNYYGPDSFNYTISDGQGGTASASVSVTVNYVNQPPVAVDVSCGARQQAPSPVYVATCTNVLAGASDPDGDTLTIVSVSKGSYGTNVYISGSTVTYVSSSGFRGSDTLTYTISDGHGHTASASIRISG